LPLAEAACGASNIDAASANTVLIVCFMCLPVRDIQNMRYRNRGDDAQCTGSC
jgi:hypothetical protein